MIDVFIKYKEKAKIWAYCYLGILYYDLKRLKESEIDIRESLRINPDYPDAHFFLGSLLFDIGKEDEAYNEYLFAVKKEPLLAEKLSILALFSESKDEKIKKLKIAKNLFLEIKNQKKAEEIEKVLNNL